MPTQQPLPLPDRPDLRHLKNQAKDLLKAGEAKSITAAQFRIARLYGFESWPRLKSHVESQNEIAQLKRAIDTNDLAGVQRLMTRNPKLHTAPLGYGKDGPLTWVAECRIPWEPPGPTRLAMAKWMIENGSDIHQGGDGPLGRATLNSDRIAMMELLVEHGANVNAWWHNWFPTIFSPCETVDPITLKWLLDHGADPNCPGHRETALDYLIATYPRSPKDLAECIDLLLEAGGKTRYSEPSVLAILRGRNAELAAHLDSDPSLVSRRFPDLDCGVTGGRMLTLRGATLLHVAAEYWNLDAARLLLDRGADVNARADIDEAGVGGQTPIFHSMTQNDNGARAVTELLLARGADLSVRAKVPGHYERPGEILDCTAVEYARLFPL